MTKLTAADGNLSHATEIKQLINAAVEYEAAANRFLDIYAERMQAAGAALYEAFTLAYIDSVRGTRSESAVLRYYRSTSPRRWWWQYLAARKVSKDWATRTIQWHLDPNKAEIRRKSNVVRSQKSRERRLIEVREYLRAAPSNTLRVEMRRLTELAKRVPSDREGIVLEIVRRAVADVEAAVATMVVTA